MKFSGAITLAAVAVGVSAQGAAIGIAPAGGMPAGCLATKAGNYEIQVVQTPADAAANQAQKRQAGLPACGGPDALVFQINNGILTDRKGRIGSIVANRQFQFDGPPPQTGAIYTGGFSICGNNSLAIGPTTNFYQCKSGNFYNLYDQPSESACMLVKFNTIQCSDSGSSASSSGASGAVSQSADGQPTASSAILSQQTDGQPTATSAPTVVSQQTDGQPTASSAVPVVSQISDGQPQATTAVSNATVTTAKPTLATGAAAQLIGSGAIAMVGAAAALFL